MNKSVYSYNCVIFPGKLCAAAFNLAFVGWLWYVDAGQRWGACSLNGVIRYNFQTWRGLIELLSSVFSTVIVRTDTLRSSRFGFVRQWHVGPLISLDVLMFRTKGWKILSCRCSEILVFSSRDYPLPSHANPCPIVRVSPNVKPLE